MIIPREAKLVNIYDASTVTFTSGLCPGGFPIKRQHAAQLFPRINSLGMSTSDADVMIPAQVCLEKAWRSWQPQMDKMCPLVRLVYISLSRHAQSATTNGCMLPTQFIWPVQAFVNRANRAFCLPIADACVMMLLKACIRQEKEQWQRSRYRILPGK